MEYPWEAEEMLFHCITKCSLFLFFLQTNQSDRPALNQQHQKYQNWDISRVYADGTYAQNQTSFSF